MTDIQDLIFYKINKAGSAIVPDIALPPLSLGSLQLTILILMAAH